MLNDFTWNMTGYIPKHAVNPHGDGIIPYVAERIFQLEPEPPQSTNTKQTAMANGAKYHWIFRTARHGGI